jgi:LmbE family N-acetylglucosaminyl deacetylase
MFDEMDLRMPATPRFTAADRVLVVAPHPDDETLAAGIAIQSALEAGAVVRILYVTDGDNNPWPQRWLEKRWSIGEAERARWGARRRQEAALARAALAEDDHTADARHLGWPDQGLTDALMRDERAVATLVAELGDFAPTSILMPALDDSHPDHSALHVMVELALLRSAGACQRYCYVVHGAGVAFDDEVDAPRFARKMLALEAYVSQLTLSRRRLLQLAACAERLRAVADPPAPDLDGAGAMHVALDVPGMSPWRHELLLVIAAREGVVRLRGALARFAGGGAEVALADPVAGLTATARIEAGKLRVLPPLEPLAAWAKLHRVGPRIVVFDRTHWRRAQDSAPLPLPAIERDIVTGLG